MLYNSLKKEPFLLNYIFVRNRRIVQKHTNIYIYGGTRTCIIKQNKLLCNVLLVMSKTCVEIFSVIGNEDAFKNFVCVVG